jgi:hypothetical protein
MQSDEGAAYCETLRIDCAVLSPLVAAPGDPGNGRPLDELSAPVKIAIAYGGSCTAGKRQDIPPERLPQPSLDQVPRDGVVPVLRDHDTDAWMRVGGSGIEDVQVDRPAPFPPMKDRTDVCASRQTARPRQSLGPAPRRHRPTLLLPDRNDQLLAPPPAAAVQRGASRTRGHARPEPVLVLPLAIARTICRLAHDS